MCYDSTGWKSCNQFELQGPEQRIPMVSPSSAKDETSCIVFYSLQAVQPVFGRPASKELQ